MACTTVHVIFKTHLDVGFTDLAANVVRRYFDSYIPQAIRVARELRAAGGPERFVWTTGSWLVYEYLEQARPAARRDLERAIADGDIRWHALPFTTHTELMDADLCRFGLSLARELDQRFGVQTIAAKMTDVPGHTRALVPLLAEAGVRFLHLGVNPASTAPAVPDLFRWREPESGAEVVVMYHKASYGSVATVPGLDAVLAFAHTGDNCGPQSADQIRQQFAGFRERFPEAVIVASTLDAFARELEAVRPQLPVVEAELGDTWIHGVGTDPLKVARFRALCRLRQQWLAAEPAVAPALRDFSRALLLVPEHTWGMDVKTHLGDFVNYTRRDFERARRRNLVPPGAPASPFPWLTKFSGGHGVNSYRHLESSWAEQRGYLDAAVRALGPGPCGPMARAALAGVAAQRPSRRGWTPTCPDAPLANSRWTVRLDPATGALVELTHRPDGRRLADARHRLAAFCYQTFSVADYDRFMAAYNVNLQHAWCYEWAIPDFGRPGLDAASAPAAIWLPAVRRAWHRQTAQALGLLVQLELPATAVNACGAPREVFLEYAFPADRPAVEITLQWFRKPASRLPEAMWLGFTPRVRTPAGWSVRKLGRRIPFLDVVAGGNRNLHGTDTGVEYAGPDGALRLLSPDVPLVAPGRPRLLEFDNSLPDLRGGVHFNLHNNVFGTNFPIWYADDGRCRFSLELG